MLDGKLFEVTALGLSFVAAVASYLLIVWKDRSWVNWATPTFILGIAGHYLFQFLYLMFSRNTGGSRFAYFFTYATYGALALIGALTYAFVRPIKLRASQCPEDLELLPWLLLTLGFLLYLPVLVEFRAYLTEPRRIYELTRSGYGLYFFGSTTLTTLGFVTFLFKKQRSLLGSIAYFSICMLLAYWHGSKGQIVTYLLIWMLYRVYVQHKFIKPLAAVAVGLGVVVLLLGSFILFGNVSDVADTAEGLTTYADYVRNGMMVIDDSNGTRYYGRLELENEIYSRTPRFLLPDKPKDFGPFILAKTYNPASYRNDEGVGAFDIGLNYADFGAWSILQLCLYAGLTSFLVATLAQQLRSGSGGAGMFIVFLFMAGVNVIPISGPFYLLETMALGGVVSLASRARLFHHPGRRPIAEGA